MEYSHCAKIANKRFCALNSLDVYSRGKLLNGLWDHRVTGMKNSLLKDTGSKPYSKSQETHPTISEARVNCSRKIFNQVPVKYPNDCIHSHH